MDKTRNGFPEPAWFGEFRQAAASSHAFILHLNVQDYTVPGVRLGDYVAKKLSAFDIVARYNRAAGITFPLASMESKAKELLGMNGQQATDPSLAALSALGLGGNTGPQDWPSAPGQALPMLNDLLHQGTAKSVVVIEWAETLWPAADLAAMSGDDRTNLVMAATWGTDSVIEANGNLVILVAGSLPDLNPVLRAAASRYSAIELPLPDRAARERYIGWYLEGLTEQPTLEMSVSELAAATAGLSLVHIENVFLQAERAGGLTWQIVRATKEQIIAAEYAGLLEIMEPRHGFAAIGGLDDIKRWFLTEVVEPLRAGSKDTPSGIILMGPPGTGKTYFVQGAAKEARVNCAALHMSNILGGIVGTSERNLAKVFAAVRSLAPVILFVDEIDQSELSSRGQGSGSPVAANLFNQVLQFLSDSSNRGRVLFIGASNRPDLLDNAFKRSGRIDALIPFLLPEPAERGAIAQAAAGGTLDAATVDALIAATDKYSGADIAAVIGKAKRLARRQGRETLTQVDVTQALDLLMPSSPKNADYYTALALRECTDREFVPARYRAMFADRKGLETIVETEAPQTRKARGDRF